MLRRKPYVRKDLGDVNLLAIPYFKGNFEDIIDGIIEQMVEDKTNVLLLHCTLSGLKPRKYGEEAEYLPVTKEQLLQIGLDYVFAGHVHTSAIKKELSSKCVFLYPGSPVSVTSAETGKRGVWLIDTKDQRVEHIAIDTFFYEEKELDLCPGEAEKKLEELGEWVQNEDLEKVELLIRTRGFIEIDEERFSQKLEDIKGKADARKVKVINEVESAKSITKTELYQRFKEKLEDKVDEEENKRIIEKLALKAFSRSAR